MSILSTIAVKVLAEKVSTVSDHCQNPVYVAAIEFGPNDVVWLSNGETNAELPSGATTVEARIREPSPASSNLNPVELATTIGGGTLDVVDINGTFSRLVQDKRLAGTGSRKAKVRLYEACKGNQVTADHLTHTLEWYNQSHSPGEVKLTLKELIYTTKETVLSASTAKLAKNYAITDTKLRLFDTGGADISEMFPVFAHTSSYRNQRYDGKENQGLSPTQPYDATSEYNKTHEAFGYVRMRDSGNLICHSGFTQYDGSVWEADIIDRGALGTTDSAIEISEDIDSAENFPDVEEVIYLEESVPEIVCMIWTGTSINGNRVFPWGLDIPRSKVDLPSLALLSNDLQTIPRVITSESSKAKEFLQDEILPIIGAFIDTNPDGKLSLKQLQTPTFDATGVATLDHSNSEVAGPVLIDRDEVYNTIAILWGYNEASDSFRYRTTNNYLESAAIYGNTETKTIELKWLQPGAQTDAAIRTIIDRLAMQYAFERVSIKVKALPSMRYLAKGQVVFCDYDGIRDSASADGNVITLKRPMIIVGTQRVKGTRQVVYSLMGYTRRPRSGNNSAEVQHLTLEQITANSTRKNLNTVCNISGGDITNPTTPLPVGSYFYDDDLRAINTTPYPLSGYGTVDLWMPTDKHFEENSTSGWFDGKGKGLHKGGKGAVTAGDHYVSHATPGERGFFGSNTGGGGVRVGSRHHGEHDNYVHGLYVESLDNGAVTQALYDDVPDLELRMEDGVILGLPEDLSGSGGGGGGWSSFRTKVDRDAQPSHEFYDGADAGRGGAGFRLVCGSFGFANGTQLDLSGENAETPATIVKGNKTFILGAASGGANGVMQLILPRGATPPDLAAYVKAKYGSPGNIGSRLPSGRASIGALDDAINHSYNAPSLSGSHSAAATIVSEVPADVVPEEPVTAFAGEDWRAEVDSLKDDLDSMFANTMRSSVIVHYQKNQPTGGTDLDYWANIEDLDPEDRPTIRQLIDGAWSLSPLEDAHAQLIAANYAASTAAQRAQLTADGKSKTTKTDEQNPDDWPKPSGYGDLLYVKPLSQVYRCEDGKSWDVNETFVDELAMPTSANIIHDPTFDEIANNGKRTWSYAPIITADVTTAQVTYGAGHGEGGGPGCLLMAYMNDDSSDAHIVTERYHPAKKGDVFRLSARIRGIRDRGLPYIRLLCFDANKNQLNVSSSITTIYLSENTNNEYVDIANHIELNDITSDFGAVNYVKVAVGVRGSFGGANPSTLNSYTRFDYIGCERSANYRRGTTYNAFSSRIVPSSQKAPSFGSSLGRAATAYQTNIYSAGDVFEVNFDFDATSDSESEMYVSVQDLENGEIKTVLAAEKVFPASISTRHFAGRATFSGLTGLQAHFYICVAIPVGGYLTNFQASVTAERNNQSID